MGFDGGKSVFLVEGGDPLLSLNPFNTAFFGLIAGMFTGDAYDLLREYVKVFKRKLTPSHGDGPENKAGGPKLDPPGPMPAGDAEAPRGAAS